MRYALLKDGELVNAILADESWQPPEGHTKEPYDPAVHAPAPEPEPETSRWVDKNRFISILHTPSQQVYMNALRKASERLTLAQETTSDPTELDENGLSCMALAGIGVAYQQMTTLDRVDVLSSQMDDYFQAASALGVYGGTQAEIDAEIVRIKADAPPA